LHLGVGGDLTGGKQPEKTFRKRLASTLSLGQKLLAFRDAVTTESNTLTAEFKHK